MFLCGCIFVSVQYKITGELKEGDFLFTILKISYENKSSVTKASTLLILLYCKSTRRKRGRKECDAICINIKNGQNHVDVRPSK